MNLSRNYFIQSAQKLTPVGVFPKAARAFVSKGRGVNHFSLSRSFADDDSKTLF
jgi:hypothetical protein